MNRHALAPLFDPARVLVLHVAGADTALARSHLAAQLGDGRAAFAAATPALLDAAQSPIAADLAWLLLDAREALDAIPALARWRIRIAVLAGAAVDENAARALLGAARAHGVRLLGPDAGGLQRPARALNLSLLGPMPPAGSVAFVAQSASLAASTIDWALDQGVGFSAVVAPGEQLDIDLAELLDFLASDAATASIVLYLEGVREPRSFLSALRAAATVKPVVVLKAGRHPVTAEAARTHSRALVGNDDVFDAALRRAGAVRVRFFVQLFSAVKCLAARYQPVGRRLAILANGGGPGVLAADWAADSGLELASLSASTVQALGVLVAAANPANPVDLGDIDAADYAQAVGLVMADPGVDGVLALYAPKGAGEPLAHAQALVDQRESYRKPLIACWLGDRRVLESRALLARARVPTFRTPEPAVDAFGNLTSFYRNQQLSWQAPPALAEGEVPDLARARRVLDAVRASGRVALSELESKEVLAAFHVPVAHTLLARSAQEASQMATRIGYPVVLKVCSPDIAHKSDVGGVALDIRGAAGLELAWHALHEGVRERAPAARIEGIAVEPMVAPRHGRELYVGVVTDALFGPVILFGAGGRTVEVHRDRAMELPPLNRFLAMRLIERARAARMLGEWRGAPAADVAAVESTLLRVSELVCALPEVDAIDLNPLIVDEHGVCVVDARMLLKPAPVAPVHAHAHLAILPYPRELEREGALRDGSPYRLRAIRPEDAPQLQDFVRGLSEQSRYFRFVASVKELSPRQLARYTQIDYWRDMALVVEGESQVDGARPFVGVARYMLDLDGTSCEFAVAIADAWQGRGLGSLLMRALLDVARSRGLARMHGMVLAQNAGMLRLMQRLGFRARPDPEDAAMVLVAIEL